MKLNTIKLENFRNYLNLEINFDPKKNINLFIGDNAQGKTNFLESITLLSLAKSFRTSKIESLVNYDKDFARIVGEVTLNKNDLVLEYFMSKTPQKKKNLRKNGVDVSVSEFIGRLNIVLFHPEDINMLYLSPSLRRKYINTILSQTDPIYFDSLVNYNRIIKQRNKYLQYNNNSSKNNEELDVWDDQLSKYGSYILEKRYEFIEFLNTLISNVYNSISQTNEALKVKYENTIEKGEFSKDKYLDGLKNNRSRDYKYKQTTKGIHRDDIIFYFNNHNISEYGSRGEMRTLIIALKLAEIEYIEKQVGHKPILLLDDVFSELDKKRQQFLLNSITPFQSFITTTHHDFPLSDETSVFSIEMGMLN